MAEAHDFKTTGIWPPNTASTREPATPLHIATDGVRNRLNRRAHSAPAKMRVLVHGMNYAPELVGVGRYTADIVSYMKARSHAVTVVTAPPHYPQWSTRPWRAANVRNRYRHEYAGGVNIWRCPLLLRRPMRGIWRMLAPLSFALTSSPVAIWRIISEKPALVLCIEPTLLSAPLTILAARLVGAKTALHVQDLEAEAARATGFTGPNLGPGLRRLVSRRLDCIVTLSPAMRDTLARSGAPHDKIHIWPNWVDVRQIASARNPAQEASWRRELGLNMEQRIALCMGTLNRKHAAHHLLEAALLLQSQPSLTIVIAGDGPMRGALQAAAAELPNVRFLPLQPEARLGALLNFADVHVLLQDPALDELALPSRLGGMLASGKPLVVTANQQSMLAKFLGSAAKLCPPGDNQALAAAIASEIESNTRAETAFRGKRGRWRKAMTLDRRRCLHGLVATLEQTAHNGDTGKLQR